MRDSNLWAQRAPVVVGVLQYPDQQLQRKQLARMQVLLHRTKACFPRGHLQQRSKSLCACFSV